ncbi:Reverse transcriptase, partial [Phytophthora palmivora]
MNRSLAASTVQWERLRRWVPRALCRDNYDGIPSDDWALLHVLPYVIATWFSTPMGRAPHGARNIWYQEYPFIERLCNNVLSNKGWSGAALTNIKGREAQSGAEPAKSLAPLHASSSMKQKTIGEMLSTLSPQERYRSRRKEFQTLKRQQARKRIRRERELATDHLRGQGLHTEDRTYGFVSHNVRGFGASAKAHQDWLHSLGRNTSNGPQDVALIQETHVHSSHIENAKREYAARWGYRLGNGSPTLSYWGAAVSRKGGVGILVNPYGAFTEHRPIWQETWSPHFVAVSGKLDGEEIIVANVYAPIDRTQREELFKALGELPFPAHGRVLLGGDFNCTLDARLDRTYAAAGANHDSPELRRLLARWDAQDCLSNMMPDQTDENRVKHFHAKYHTYRYQVNGDAESSRLDRWYGSSLIQPWIAATEVVRPAARSDHDGAQLHLRSPNNPLRVKQQQRTYPTLRVKQQQRTYPVPNYAKSLVDAYTNGALDALRDRLQSAHLTADEAATLWENTKRQIRKGILNCKKTARRRRTRTYRQKLTRLLRLQRAALAAETSSQDDIDDITARLDGLDIQSTACGNRLEKIRAAIVDLQIERGHSKMAARFRQNTWHAKRVTSKLFRSTSAKFADNAIPTIVPAADSPQRN